MPTLGWTSDRLVPGTAVVAFATHLPLMRRRSTLRFLRDAVAVRRQLDALAAEPDSGLLWYWLRADPVRNEYTTASAWLDDAALRAFALAEPHRSVMERHRAALGAATLTGFTVDAAQLPLDATEIDRRLAAAGAAPVPNSR